MVSVQIIFLERRDSLLSVIEKVSFRGDKPWNEDRLVVDGGYYVVIDGSTPENPSLFKGYNSSGEWIADKFREFLSLSSNNELDFRMKCIEFINYTFEIFRETEEHNSPCLTCAAVSFLGDTLHCDVIGDCSIYLRWKTGKIKLLTDKSIDEFSKKTLRMKREAMAKGEDPEEAVTKQQQANRFYMNKRDGYYVVGYNNGFLEGFQSIAIPVNAIDKILLCTDGFSRVFDYGLVSSRDIFHKEVTLNEAVKLLRDYENTHGNKVKKSDDATALLLA